MIRFLGILGSIVVALLVYEDAKSRRMNATLWAILGFFIIPLIIYFFVRKPKY